MAVMIAQDVIAQIIAKKFIPTTGFYVASGALKPGDLQKQVRSRTFKPCMVCALGSAWLSKARLFNDITLDDDDIHYGIDRSNTDDDLEMYFSIEEMDAIEAAFEHGEVNEYTLLDYNDLLQLMHDIYDDSERLLFLMREVVRQKGRFDLATADERALRVLRRAAEIKEDATITALKEMSA